MTAGDQDALDALVRTCQRRAGRYVSRARVLSAAVAIVAADPAALGAVIDRLSDT